MRHLLKSVLAVAVIVISADILAGKVGDALLWHTQASNALQPAMCQAILHQQADILVLGSSRARHHYSTHMLHDSLHMSVYNAGYDGHDMAYANAVFHAMLKRHRPRVVVLDVCNNQLNGAWKTNSLNDYKCFYRVNESVSRIVDKQADWLLKTKMTSNMYRLNGTWVWLLKARMSSCDTTSNGYEPMDGMITKPKDIHFDHFLVDAEEQAYLDDVVKTCQNKGIALYMAITPSYEIDSGLSNWFESYVTHHGVAGSDYTMDPRFYHRAEFFKDHGHLNRQGAERYTAIVIQEIKHLLP